MEGKELYYDMHLGVLGMGRGCGERARRACEPRPYIMENALFHEMLVSWNNAFYVLLSTPLRVAAISLASRERSG
jgi:hypothetical protein